MVEQVEESAVMGDFFEFSDTAPAAPPQMTKKPPKGGVVVNTQSSEFLSGDTASFNFDFEKQRFLDHMEFLQNQSVQEHTLYKKWIEVTTMFNSTADIVKAAEVEAKIWVPTDITNLEMTVSEIERMEPEVVFVPENGPLFEDWKYLRVFVSSFEFKANPGRLIRILIRDKTTQKYLGVCSIASDVAAVKCRDEWIGWTKDNKFKDGMLNHTAIGTTIVPTQPFGFNFLGGKLVASMLCTKSVQDAWKEKFGNTLAGMTTTSLYGGHSMYQRIPFWKELGDTAGKINIKPDDSIYNIWLNWIKVNKPEEYERATMPYVGTIIQDEQTKVYYVDSQFPEVKYRKTLSWNDKEDLIKTLHQDQYSVHSNGDIYDPKSRHSFPPTGPKQQCLYVILRALGLSASKYEHGYQRGVYFAPFYENTREFLRKDIDVDRLVSTKKLERDVDAVLDWWKPKAIARYKKLHAEGRLLPEVLYYRKMVQMEWNEVREKYLSEVGR
jgi:hypothetical protein